MFGINTVKKVHKLYSRRLLSFVFYVLEEFCKALNGFSLTQLKDYIEGKNEKSVKRSFKELPFYGTSIEKPYTKRLNNIDVMRELPFYDELKIVKSSKAFQRYVRNCSVEVIDSKDSSTQLTIISSSIKDLYKDLLAEIRKRIYSCLF